MFNLELALPPRQAPRLLRHLADVAARQRGNIIRMSWPEDAVAKTAHFVGRRSPFTRHDPDLTCVVQRGTVRANGQARGLCRLSVSGDEAAVHPEILGLAEGFTLTPWQASLPDEAAALATGEPIGTVAPGTMALPPDIGVGAGFTQIALHLGPIMLDCAAAVGRGGDDPEPVHQMRVALRRLRSAFAMFRPVIACPATAEVAAGLRTLTAALGPARDWDVFLAETGAQVATAFPDSAPVAALLHAAALQRDTAYTELATVLAGAAFRRLMVQLALLAHGTFWHTTLTPEQHTGLEQPLADFAAAVLARRHRRVLRAGKGFRHRDMPALHVLRLQGKRLRYAAEFFATLHNPGAAARFIARLSRLQERLGKLNDAAVVTQLMDQLGPHDGANGFAIGVVQGFAAAEAARARDKASRPWRRFRKLDPFWT